MSLHELYGWTIAVGLIWVLLGWRSAYLVDSNTWYLARKYGRIAQTIATAVMFTGMSIGVCITALGCIGLMLLYY